MKPKLATRLRLAINDIRGTTTKNNAQLTAARHFLKHGNGKTTTPNWSQVIMSDYDVYSGTMYGAIKKRAVSTSLLATYHLKTKAKQELENQAKTKEEKLVHPYIEIIDKSPTVTNWAFWSMNARRLDLKGITYILAVRNVAPNLVGEIQEFKLLNPYNVERIFDKGTGELIGYKEYKPSIGKFRDLPKEMVISVIDPSPIDDEPHGMVAAAKDNQFTIKTANDYTRSAIANNINAPGIIVTDRELEGEELANFKERILSHQKGEPIFGGGAGSISWNDMQADLNKAALDKVNSIQLNNIIAVSGVSKTMLAIEESGTTRDTAKIQKDNFTESEAMSLLQMIIDALNQDFKNYYRKEYEKTGFTLYIDNPIGSDREGELKDVEIRTKSHELFTMLVNQGYDSKTAAKFADGKLTLEEIGEPTVKPEVKEEPKKPEEPEENKADNHVHLQELESGLLNTTQASLQNTIINIDNRLLAAVANHVGQTKNDFESEDDLISKRERNALQNELEIALAAFYGIILPLYAYNVLSKRLETYGTSVQFKMNNTVRAFIKEVAGSASQSHIETLLNSMIKQAQKDALAGLGRDQIARNLINKYGGEISNSRAVLIARTETNRAFTMSQYQADLQFIKQGGYDGRAFKVWTTRSGNPCEFCQAMAAQPPIPFTTPFAEVGDGLTATALVDGKSVVRKMTVGFMDVEAGNLHPNCGCIYELIIES